MEKINVTESQITELTVVPEFLWFMLAIALLFFISMSFVFHYHWKKYGVEDNPKVFAKSLYWIASFILIIVMVVSLMTFEYL